VSPKFLFFILFCALLQASDVNAQDKTLHLDEIEVKNIRDKFNGHNQSLDSREIGNSNSEDVGGLLQKFTGITVKNYGGVGAIKTISFRGISGTHTGIVLDGFLIQNNQIGQVDLSTLPTENLERISFINGGNEEELVPVSALNLGNYLSMSSFESTFPMDQFSIRTHSKIGSFGYFDNYFALKQRVSRSFYSVSGKYRIYQGDFDYLYKNGNQPIQDKRSNNDLKDGGIVFSFGSLIGKSTRFFTSYQTNGFDKGLPGPIILYNGFANQRLQSTSQNLNSELIICKNKISSKFYFSGAHSNLTYNDPSFLNQAKNYTESYLNRYFQIGNTSKYTIKDSVLKLIFGAEHTFSELHTIQSTNGVPKRLQTQFIVGITGQIYHLNYTMQVGKQFVNNTEINRVANYQPLTTIFIIERSKPIKWLGSPRISFKKTYRLPSFGELYYHQIGNTNLKPELVYQSNIGSTFKVSSIDTEIMVDAYRNYVEDKIVAIPTKNLFVWSIQNVGKVEVNGFDLNMLFSSTIFRIKSTLKFGYSYQSVIDVTDPASPTYGHQIAYLPKHSLHGELTVSMNDWVQFGCNSVYNSTRYSLNENIAFNEVASFFVSDIFLNMTLALKKNHSLKVGMTVKNCLNSSYESIKSFVMPGRNYLLSVIYAFH
jgi:vitamin B12 transporter